MRNQQLIKEKFSDLQVCVIIPTYNNAGTLLKVISEVSRYSEHIIIVNDGSTDETSQLLASAGTISPFIETISYMKNRGKGWALRKAFSLALSQGYHYAITIDSDGQHFANDLPVFIQALLIKKDALIIGSRNMDQSSIPGKSSFGHKFSNFWFKVETGIDCPDTQSGFRLYPLLLLKDLKFVTRKYEFEIEVLVRAAWMGIKLGSVPVTVYYAPLETRISHFRPFRDFSRVSILNAFLVVIAFAWIKPRDALRNIWRFLHSIIKNKKKRAFYIQKYLINPQASDRVKSISLGLGVFIGIMPIWGFQSIAGLFLAFVFRLNKVLVVLASQVRIPPLIPLIIFFSYKAGALWGLPGNGRSNLKTMLFLKQFGGNLQQYLLGSITLAVLGGTMSGLLAYILFKIFKKPLTSSI